MEKIVVEVIKYKSDKDGMIFDDPITCKMYEECYDERNFRVKEWMLNSFTNKSWKHFMYEFLSKYAVCYFVNTYPVPREFYKDINSKEDFIKLVKLALNHTLYPDKEKVDCFGEPIVDGKFFQYEINNCEHGFIRLKYFNYNPNSFLIERYEGWYSPSLGYKCTIWYDDAVYDTSGQVITFMPSDKTFTEFLKFLCKLKLIKEYKDVLMKYAEDCKDRKAIIYLNRFK